MNIKSIKKGEWKVTRKNKLIDLTPEIWGVIEYLGETGVLDINDA
ncbi:MAG: hypothetical protein ACE5J9_06910 [Methanosarcinales archaeon]